MIKAVIFDVGGVLIRTQDHSHRREWEQILGLDERESEEIVFNSEMGQKAQKGEISDQQLWAWVDERLNLGDRLEAFRDGFWAGDQLDMTLISYIQSLRPKYQTAIISNATDGLRNSLTNEHKISRAFDLIIGSAEEKTMKPDHKIYWLALKRLGRHPNEAVFIDDFAQNIRAAQEVGMATIHYQPGIHIPAELAKLGVITGDE
ncbi:MAG: HAD family phosphatase [Candidatus Promineifilaceae bacterium]|nr:HAD family phosphatase [Candidatus Promineifilaceae bacterium]